MKRNRAQEVGHDEREAGKREKWRKETAGVGVRTRERSYE